MGGTLLTQIFCFINDRGIMYHSPYMWKYCSETTPFGPHIDWYGLTSGKSGILTDYDQRDAHVLKWNHEKIHIRAARDWDIPSQNCSDAIYPSVAILASRHFWMAHSLITTKTLVVGGTLLTKSFRLCNDQEIMYHSPYYAWCFVSLVRHIGWIQPNWYTYPEAKSRLVWLYQVSPRSSYTWLGCSSKTPFWCYISVGGHPDVTSVQGGILAD